MSVGLEVNGPSHDEDAKSDFSHRTVEIEIKSDLGFVSPNRLEHESYEYDKSSQDAKSWLVSYGDLKVGTNVSLRFKIEQSDVPKEGPFSMLPLLTRWTRSWLDRSLTEAQDRNNLTWLLQYTADYIALGHYELNHKEIRDLCMVELYVCNNARQHNHIEACLAVYFSIIQQNLFPKECLIEVLGTFSSAIVILERPLSRVGPCVALLASGTLGKDVVEVLCDQMLSVCKARKGGEAWTSDQTASILTPARGAVRHLGTLVETTDPNNEFVLNIRQVLQVLKQTAETGLLRLATVILDVLAQLIKSSRVGELSHDQSLIKTILEISDMCQESKIIPDTIENYTAKGKSLPKEDIVRRERRYRRDHDLAIAKTLEAELSILALMSKQNAQRVWDSSKNVLEDLSPQAKEVLFKYIENQEITMPGKSVTWYQELNLLVDKVVVGQITKTDSEIELGRHEGQTNITLIQEQVTKRVKQRVDVLRLCSRSAAEMTKMNSDDTQSILGNQTVVEAGLHVVQKLLTIFGTERNNEVMQVFLDEMIRLSAVATDAGVRVYAPLIIKTLQDDVLMNAPSDTTMDGIYCAATKAICSIFLQSLGMSDDVANQAYQALLKIANCKQCKSRRSRLAAMSLLFRIRCDTSGKISIGTSSGSTEIASALCKTDESLGAMFSETDADSNEVRERLQKISRKQLWIYPQEDELTKEWVIPENTAIYVEGSRESSSEQDLDVSDWVWVLQTNLQEDKDWETYSFVIVHLGSQLVNTKLFEHSQEYLASLRGFLSGRVRERANMFEPPKDIGLDKADVALCFYHILTRLIPYAKMQPPNLNFEPGRRGVDLVRAFRAGLAETYMGTAKSCIHSLSICCFELPEAIGTEYPALIQVMMQNISQGHLLVHVLEFLAQVARLPHLHKYFMENEIRQIFGICITALKYLRQDDKPKYVVPIDSKRDSAFTRRKGGLQTPYRSAMLKEKGLPQYSSALAYHTMIFWFLSIPIGRRSTYVGDIISKLTWKDAAGQENIDEQTIVFIDMMQRCAFSDLPETARDESFSGDDYESTSFVDGNSIITVETHKITGRSQFTKRQAAGTTHAVYTPNVQTLPLHHDKSFFEQLAERGLPDRVTPSHTLLNMICSAVPFTISEQPLKLNPNEPYVARGLRNIDRIPTVDSHKIAVTLLKAGQTSEQEYLANSSGTLIFDSFLESLGTRMSLKPPCAFVPFGLVDGLDGQETIAWRDRINEIVYEISTFMPNVDGDEYQARKKSHLGNCLVLIIFNQSNQPWNWDSFTSQATLVNIVITPANRVSNDGSSDDYEHEYFQVHVLTKEEYQNISAAAETKVVSRASLASFVRTLALNANIFSECARNESTGDAEFPSSWRYRLQEIRQLRDRTQQRIPGNEDSLAKRYDFARWT